MASWREHEKIDLCTMKGKHCGRYFGFSIWKHFAEHHAMITGAEITWSVKGQDDEVNVTLLRPIGDITDHLRDTGELLYNREANDLVVLRSN